MKEKIQFDSKTQLASYWWKEVPENATVTLTGWGRLSAGGGVPSKLHTIDLNYISYEECATIHASRGSAIDYGNLCTFTKKNEGACNGDSGSPLTYDGADGHVIVGLVNWGVPCGRG